MVKILNNENFEEEVLNISKTVLVDFYADWCGPCKMMGPVVEEIAKEITDICVGKVNIDENQELAIKYNVVNIPTLIVFKEGKESARLIGFHSKQEIISELRK